MMKSGGLMITFFDRCGLNRQREAARLPVVDDIGDQGAGSPHALFVCPFAELSGMPVDRSLTSAHRTWHVLVVVVEVSLIVAVIGVQQPAVNTHRIWVARAELVSLVVT